MYKNFNQIVKETATKLNLSIGVVEEIVKNQFECVRDAIEHEDDIEVRLKYLGSFKARKDSKLKERIKNKKLQTNE